MTTQTEALMLAREYVLTHSIDAGKVFIAIEEALAQPEQEPSYWIGYGLQAHTEKPFEGATPVYTTPPQRTWVGLSREDCYQVRERESDAFMYGVAWAEAKLKEKNT